MGWKRFLDRIKNSEITEPIEFAIEPLNDTVLENVLENILPFASFIVIATIQGKNYISGKSTITEASKSLVEKSVESGIAIGSGALALAIFASMASYFESKVLKNGIHGFVF